MSKSVMLVAIAVSLLGTSCAKDPKSRLQGKWLGDSVSNAPPEQASGANAWVKGMSFEFAGSRLTVTIPAEQPRTGEYKVEEEDGNRVTLKVLREEGISDTATLTFAEDRTLHWDIGEGRHVVLTRLQ